MNWSFNLHAYKGCYYLVTTSFIWQTKMCQVESGWVSWDENKVRMALRQQFSKDGLHKKIRWLKAAAELNW